MADELQEPMSAMGQAAAGLHVTYVAMREAGFTEREAILFIATSVSLSSGAAEEPPAGS